MAADATEDFLSNFLYIFKWQIHKDDLSKLNFHSLYVKEQPKVSQKQAFQSFNV